MKTKVLMILHRTPPIHGAAKVGDFISSSQKINKEFNCKFITIKSSQTISDIGKIDIKKIYYLVELYMKILLALFLFRPDKIYFTASISSVAFYRDLVLSILFKCYKLFKKIDIYYHYHTKGVDDFVKESKINLYLTRFFIKDITLVLLSPMLEKDFDKVKTFKRVRFLPNGVENNLEEEEFHEEIKDKYNGEEKINILYLSNMIKSKGYFEILKLARKNIHVKVHFHFAGGWQNVEDEKEFLMYIKKNNLSNIVTFHGFLNGEEKQSLFKKSHLFLFPTRYKNEAFPLSILEAFSYGIPTISTDEGSIPYILDKKSGIIFSKINNLSKVFNEGIESFINIESAKYCRKRYLDNFSLEKFENNFIKVIS